MTGDDEGEQQLRGSGTHEEARKVSHQTHFERDLCNSIVRKLQKHKQKANPPIERGRREVEK